MNRHLSLTSVRTLAPEAFRRWVIGGVALSLVGYVTVLLTGILHVISKPFSGRALTTRIADLLRADVRTGTAAP